MRYGGSAAMLLFVGAPSKTVPRDPVWTRARAYCLPLTEYVRMGGPECAIGRHPRDSTATMNRSAAIALLGELEIDDRWPHWGEHRAALAGVPDARLHAQFKVSCPQEADSMHTELVDRLGTEALAAVMAGS